MHEPACAVAGEEKIIVVRAQNNQGLDKCRWRRQREKAKPLKYSGINNKIVKGSKERHKSKTEPRLLAYVKSKMMDCPSCY